MTQHKTLAEKAFDEILKQKGLEFSSNLNPFDMFKFGLEYSASQFVNPSIDIKDIDPEIGAAFNEFSKQNRRRTPKRERESQFIKKDDELNSAEKIQAIYNEMPESRLKDHLAKWFSLNKEVVSSDVEQAAKDLFKANSYRYYGADVMGIEKFTAIIKSMQSTRQPATINFFSDEEIESLIDDFWLEFKGTEFSHNAFTKSSLHSIKMFQSKLKERVNCVDPWISVNDRLPELEQEVLSFSPNEGIRQTKYTTYQEGSTGHSQGDKDCWFEWVTHNNFAWKHRATHWMPLLNSPKTTPNGQAKM